MQYPNQLQVCVQKTNNDKHKQGNTRNKTGMQTSRNRKQDKKLVVVQHGEERRGGTPAITNSKHHLMYT
jgi:hypothetical protein